MVRNTMRRPTDLKLLIKSTAIFVLALLSSAAGASAQVGAPRSQTGASSQAIQLPLSGRNNQGGSVSVSQSPVPGTTTSVNTINPTIQVQGPFSGTSLSTSGSRLAGRLSLREAVQRAIEYN